MFYNQKQVRKANRQRKQENLAKRKRLEAASPDLLAACEKASTWMMWLKQSGQCKCEKNSRGRCIKCVVTDELVEVEAAIAKAKKM
ncbi:hypothetical protein LCGC14_1881010 [marine sediment metagenome]|uniref:Uncharacterized protein n=1 Tax=marine sediment metagenome TaxID=412755 RepID=A0A0F9GQJ9_9ZZZZ